LGFEVKIKDVAHGSVLRGKRKEARRKMRNHESGAALEW
jgi:hypothetical protein